LEAVESGIEPAAVQPPLPHFEVRIAPPDVAKWLGGNTGVRGFISRESGRPGPHVAIVALTHGNELAGAIAVERLLTGDVRPACGRLTLGFANLAAFDRFDPRQPTSSRFVDEDLNRIWESTVLDGPRQSNELIRAREMRPLIETVDVLLDLHSMLWASEPLLLSGASEKGRRLALAIGVPDLVVADPGHASGRRMIDYARFSDPDSAACAVLVEAGQHWEMGTIDTTLACIGGLLRHLRMVVEHPVLPPPATGRAQPRFAEVTAAVTAQTGSFSFTRPFRGGDVIAERGSLIALDGGAEIRTPHDDCLLVMPSLRPSRGHTAVRLARFATA
jgi:predicted deacylase